MDVLLSFFQTISVACGRTPIGRAPPNWMNALVKPEQILCSTVHIQLKIIKNIIEQSKKLLSKYDWPCKFCAPLMFGIDHKVLASDIHLYWTLPVRCPPMWDLPPAAALLTARTWCNQSAVEPTHPHNSLLLSQTASFPCQRSAAAPNHLCLLTNNCWNWTGVIETSNIIVFEFRL